MMKLFQCLTTPIESKVWGESIANPTGKLYFRDNGASVLAVAHLDSVMETKPHREGRYVWAPQLDDRLGVWALLYLFPRMGITVDVLLTDCEEVGQSTASHFIPGKEYNWLVEFDRRGDDVVMYEYETAEYTDLMREYNFQPGLGAFSDICTLEHLGVAGFNFGTGYYWEHTLDCWADLNTTRKQVRKFAKFWTDHKDTPLPHTSYIWDRHDYGYPEDTMSADDWDNLEDTAAYHGYTNVTRFIQDGGFDLMDGQRYAKFLA